LKAQRTLLMIAAAAGFTALLTAMTGCDKDGPYGLKFSHFQHVTDTEMACADCHGKLGEKGFKEIDHDACVDCHEDEVDAEAITKKTCGYCHKVKNLDDLGNDKAPTPSASRGVFVHTDTLSNLCVVCHGMLVNKGKNRVPRLSRSMFVKMRTRSHALGMKCTACHIDMAADVAPASHDHGWKRRHGVHATEENVDCTVCHKEETCRECHQTTMPSSHNNLWRLKTHGIQADWDRQRCQTCHEEDFCSSCHAEVRPRSHNASWERRHCTECHSSASTGAGCATCHEGSLEAHPNPHAAGWRSRHCNTCHVGSPKERECRVCHQGSIETHPNPHSAGWRRRHCDNCHPGTAQEKECRICHGGGIDTHTNPHSAGWRDRHCFTCHPGSQAANECAVCHEGGSSLLTHADDWPPIHDLFGDQIDCNFCHTP
jgi:hypothetical protein